MASPRSDVISRCRDANRIESLSTDDCHARMASPDRINVVDVAKFPAKRDGAVDRKRFFVVGCELIS